MATTVVKTLKDLKGASYNPRYISEKQLKALQKSIVKFGDLSGIVFNSTSGVLISGHQRIKTLSNFTTKIVKAKHKDKHGTTYVGHIEADTDAGLIKVPYREVAWDDKLSEMAANVAANAAGGEFDQAKLGAVMAKLEKGGFDIEATSIDNWQMSKAIGKFKKSGNTDGRDDKYSAKDGEDGEDFETIDPKSMKFAHECPKCGFKFGDPAKEGAAARKTANAAKLIQTTKAAAAKKTTTKKTVAKKTAPAKKAKR